MKNLTLTIAVTTAACCDEHVILYISKYVYLLANLFINLTLLIFEEDEGWFRKFA